MTKPSPRLDVATRAVEQALCQRISMLEQQMSRRLVVHPRPAVRPPDGRRTSRASLVDALEDDVASLDTSRGADADDIRALWSELVTLQWELALTAVRVSHREARRLMRLPGLDEQDLVQEGMIGLLAAARRFDPGANVRFATYARWWVRAEMIRAIEVSRLVRLPASAVKQLRSLRSTLAVRDRDGPRRLQDAAEYVGIGIERARRLLAVGPPISLDEEPEKGPASFLVDEQLPSPEEIVAAGQQSDLLHHLLDSAVPDRTRQIVALRYGIGRPPASVAEIAEQFSLSTVRIRQILRSALLELRADFPTT